MTIELMEIDKIKDNEDLKKFLSQTRSALKNHEVSQSKTDDLVRVLKDGLETIRRDTALKTVNRERSHLSNSDAEVVREYHEESADEAIAHLVAQRPMDLGYEGSNVRGQAKFIGSKDHGVVRLLGGDDGGIEYEHGLLDDPEPKSDWQGRLQELADLRSIARSLGKNTPKLDRAIKRHIRRGPAQIAKVFADNTGEGAEFIPDIVSPVLQRTAELTRVVEGLFPTMRLPTGGVTRNPFHVRGVMMFIHGVPTAGDLNPGDLKKSVPVTSDRTVSPVTYTASIPADLDAAEDSIIAWAPYARLNLAEAGRDSFEDAIINSDLPTHQDTGLATWNPRGRWQADLLGTTKDHRLGFVGLRARAFDVSGTTDLNATQTVKAYMQNLSTLTVPHAFEDVVYLANPEQFLFNVLIDDDVRTVDKFGPSATVLTGQIAAIGGRPVILSEFMTADLAATGLFTGAGTQAGMLALNRRRFVVAVRRGLSIGSETVLRSHTNYWVGSMRKTFHTFDDSSTKNVVNYINLDTQ